VRDVTLLTHSVAHLVVVAVIVAVVGGLTHWWSQYSNIWGILRCTIAIDNLSVLPSSEFAGD